MRKILWHMLAGISIGITANQALNLAASYALHLGYYAPCLATLPEIAGGELNGASLQMAAMAAVGGMAGLAAWGWKKHRSACCAEGKRTA